MFWRPLCTLLRFVVAWLWSLWMGFVICTLCVFVSPTFAWLWARTRWGRVTLALVDVRLNVTGRANLIEPAVYIANHASLIDVVVLPAMLPPKTKIVAKKSLMRIPLWGWAFASSGALLIDRSNARAAFESLREGVRRLPAGWSLAVFPEGTRSKDGQLKSFKRGAFLLAIESGLPVVPIGIHGARSIISDGEWLVRAGEVHVHIGEAIDTRAWQTETLRQHMAEGQAAVQACMQQAAASAAVASGSTPGLASGE